MSRSRPSCCLSLVTSATTSPRTMVELVHSAVSSFDENTYFCMASILSAHGWVLPGQIFAKLSYVFRPINIASHASSWPNPSRRYASSRYSKNPVTPAPVKTPSTETRVYSIIFRIRWCPFPFHLICERCQSPFTHRTPLWSQTHRRLKTNMGSRAEKSVHQKKDGLPGHPGESGLIFLIACCTSSHRHHSMRVTPRACPVHRSRCQITPLFFGHCGWLTNDER